MNVYNEPQYDDFTGFTFNGQHSSQFGLLRVSNGNRYEDTLVLSSSDEAADIPGGPGQYYWGETLKARTFPINIAYDEVTEVDKRRIKKWLHPDDKLHELIFDERPYVKYWVKCTKEVVASELCFRDGNGGRIYKGEFNLSFIAYMPYGVAVGKTLEDVSRTYNNDSMDTATEWKEASGLLENLTGYDNFGSKALDKQKTGIDSKVYNPGDIEAGFELKFQCGDQNRTYLVWGGTVEDTTVGNWNLVTSILTKDSTGKYAIIKNGLWKQFTINNTLFPNINTNDVKGTIVTEDNKSKFESSEDGQIYDIYKYNSGAVLLAKFNAPKNRIDFDVGYIVYAIHRKTKKVYKFDIISKANSTDDMVTLTVLPIDITADKLETSGVSEIWGDIAKNTNCIIGMDIARRNPVQEFGTFSLIFPPAATIHPNDWSEAQKALFYNSIIKIDTNKQTINYKINDTNYGITTEEWTGISGILGGSLFKIPPITNDNTYFNIQSDTIYASDFTIDYTYLYK